MLINILLIVHILVALAIIVLVLLQQGKGSDMGAAFGGGGGSQTLFGSQGSATFLSRVTAGLAAVFFLGSLTLAWLYTDRGPNASIIQDSEQTELIETSDDTGVPTIDDSAEEATGEDGVPSAPDDGAAGDSSSGDASSADSVPTEPAAEASDESTDQSGDETDASTESDTGSTGN